MGTLNPKNTFHIVPDPSNPVKDPIRIDSLQLFQAGKDTTVLVCDPDSGVVRYMPLSSLFLRKRMNGLMIREMVSSTPIALGPMAIRW